MSELRLILLLPLMLMMKQVFFRGGYPENNSNWLLFDTQRGFHFQRSLAACKVTHSNDALTERTPRFFQQAGTGFCTGYPEGFTGGKRTQTLHSRSRRRSVTRLHFCPACPCTQWASLISTHSHLPLSLPQQEPRGSQLGQKNSRPKKNRPSPPTPPHSSPPVIDNPDSRNEHFSCSRKEASGQHLCPCEPV